MSLFVPLFTARAADTLSGLIPNDPYWSRQWYLRQIHMPDAWQIATGSPRVVVAVLDGGVDITHPELRDNIWTNPREIASDGIDNDQNGLVDDLHGWNFVSKNSDVGPIMSRYPQAEESWSHGTFVASLIGARGNNGVGMSGVAWRVQIMPLTVLDSDGFGNMQTVIQALRYAIQQHVDIINLSLSGTEYNEDLEQILKEAYDAGIFVVAATGNNEGSKFGVNTDVTPVYPACMDAQNNVVFGVGGTDTLDQKAPYANFGRSCTDLVAPAQAFFGARPSYHRTTDQSTSTAYYLEGMTGTSLAAPLVSGAAALLKSVRPDLTPEQIGEALRYSADSIETSLPIEEQGRMGAGRLNVARALARVAPATPLKSVAFTQAVHGGVMVQSAFLQDEWRMWTHAASVPVARWITTSTKPEALALIVTTSTWTRELWSPDTNYVSSTVLWTEKSGSPSPVWNASTTHALMLIKKERVSQAIIFDPITNERRVVSLPNAFTQTSLRVEWWQAQAGWVIWSTAGEGIVVDEKGEIIGRLDRRVKGKTTARMSLRLSADKKDSQLMDGKKRISGVRLRFIR